MMGLFIAFLSLNAQTESDIIVEKVNDQLYKIKSIQSANRISNVLVFTGDEGALVIDAGYGVTAQKLDSAVRELTNNNIKYLINTHFHTDHMGANHLLGKGAIKIAHHNLREELTSGLSILQDYPQSAIPDITFRDSLTLYFNNQEITLYHQPYSHTHSDIIVYFKELGILCMGDLLLAGMLPYTDLKFGARIPQYLDNMNGILARFPDSTLFIGGHGINFTKKDLKKYISELTKTHEVVLQGLKEGKSVKDMQEEKILQEWEYMVKGMVSTNAWIFRIAYCETHKEYVPKKSLVGPLYQALKENNTQAAIETYNQLKQNQMDEYAFGPGVLNDFGYYLVRHEMLDDAIEIFKLNVKEYPSNANAYDSLGEVYLLVGNKENAKTNYQKVLELNPNSATAKKALEEL